MFGLEKKCVYASVSEILPFSYDLGMESIRR